jgi:hypothetical protein
MLAKRVLYRLSHVSSPYLVIWGADPMQVGKHPCLGRDQPTHQESPPLPGCSDFPLFRARV